MSSAITVITIISAVIAVGAGIVGMVLSRKARSIPFSSLQNDKRSLSDIQKLEMSEGLVIPIIYGTVETSGNIIWWSYSKEDETHYNVKLWIVIAQGICTNEYFGSKNWILIDNKFRKADNIKYILKEGLNNTKLPQKVGADTILDNLPDNGKYASKLKNICHLFIYNFVLDEYATYIPLLTFKLRRQLYTPFSTQDIYKTETVLIFDEDEMKKYNFNDVHYGFTHVEPRMRIAISRNGQYRLVCCCEKIRSGWAVYEGSLWLSNNYGDTYSKVFLTTEKWTDVAVSKTGRIMLAIINGKYPYISKDYGVTWTQLITPIGANVDYTCCTLNEKGNTIVIGAIAGGVIVSHDYGNTWYPTAHTNMQCYDVACSDDGNTIAMVSLNRTVVYLSTDGAVTWQTVGDFDEPRSICMDSSGTRLYVVDSMLNKCYASYNTGYNWESFTDEIEYLNSIRCDDSGKLLIITQRADGIEGSLGNGYFTSSDYGKTITERKLIGSEDIYKFGTISGNGKYLLVASPERADLYWEDFIWQMSCERDINLFIGHNPIAIIYDLLISQLKKTSNDIDIVNFNDAAEIMYDKMYALNIIINQPTTIKDIIDKIQNICNLYLIKDNDDRYKILIFDKKDPVKATIEDIDIVDINFTRKSWEETYNSFTAIYNPAYEIDTQYPDGVNRYVINQRSITIKNDANINLTGNIRSKTIDMSWLGYKPAVEERLKEIMLRESYPFAIVNLSVGIKYAYLTIGDLIRINSTDFFINDVFRIIDIETPEIDNIEIKITCMEL